ncbi:universal stress protein [Paenarthrobacter sp.]|uniref:universal stress protein n=1 Tax=Paenarthrobacter sp. TaxID=1931993 RepID=UPI0028116DD0|nr:universal stress protein [Paenarthrobacter sp.]
MENTLLVGIDDSHESAVAAAWALEEAEALKWRIVLAHAVTPADVADPELEARYFRRAVGEAERMFGPFLADAAARNIPAEGRVVPGNAKDVLIQLSARAGIVVVGRRHRTGYTSRFGSVSSALAAHSSCWTAVIPETWRQDDSTPAAVADSGRSKFLGHVIVAVDEGPEASSLLAVAAEMAHSHGVPMSAFTVVPDGAGPDSVSWLPDLLRPASEKHPGLQGASYTLKGAPSAEIAEAAHGARLLVVGSRGLSGLPGILRGSVSQAVLERSFSPVLVVPSRLLSHKQS